MQDETYHSTTSNDFVDENLSTDVEKKVGQIQDLDARIQQTLKQAEQAVSAVNDANIKPRGLFKNTKRIKNLQNASIEISAAVASNAKAIGDLYRCFTELSETTTDLIRLSATNLVTVREAITLLRNKINGAGGKPLSDISRRQIQNAINELRKMEDIFQEQSNTKKALKKVDRELERLDSEVKKLYKQSRISTVICIVCAVIVVACVPLIYFIVDNGGININIMAGRSVISTQKPAGSEAPTAPVESAEILPGTTDEPIVGEVAENAVPSNTQEIVSDSNDQVPTEGVASIPPTGNESEAAIQSPMFSPEGTINENNRDPDVSSDVPIPAASENVPGYTIDTIATELNDFRSMVINNAGVVYFINGNTVYNSADNETLDLSSDFETKLSNSYLAYDQYNDIVYLLADGKGSSAPLLYDITDFNGLKLVLNTDNCSYLAKFRLAYASNVTPQIAVLSDGSLLVPADLDGTYRINPKTKLVTRFNRVYDLQSPYFAKVIGSDIVEMREESTDATIIPLTGGAEYSIQLERPAPYNNKNSVCSTSQGIFFYWENVGLCKYSITGEFEIAVKQEKIVVQDFQPLDNTNIWSITANESGWVAFYDNSLKCIRLIWCE